jgi:orotidine-5'-phosphate decarboxylase
MLTTASAKKAVTKGLAFAFLSVIPGIGMKAGGPQGFMVRTLKLSALSFVVDEIVYPMVPPAFAA